MNRMLMTLPVLAALVLTGATLADDKAPQKARSPTPAELNKMVENLGLKTTTVRDNVFEFTYVRDDYRIGIRLGITGDRIGLVCPTTYVPRPAEVPAAAFRKLLELNDQRSPDRWLYAEQDRYLTFVRTFDAPGLTPAALKKQLDSFHAAVKTQKDAWDAKPFTPALKPIVDDGHAKKERVALKEKFEAVKGVFNGVETDLAGFQKEENRFQIDFVKGRWIWGKNDLAFEVRLEPGEDGGPARLSLYRGDNKVLYRGIYKFDGKTLTLCLDYTGQSFPAEFDGGEGKNTWLLTLAKK